MTVQEYIAGFFGIIFGLSIAELLKGLYKTIINSARVDYFIPHGIALCSLFVINIIFFFDYFRLFKTIAHWSPLILILHATPLISVYFVMMLVFPSFKNDQIDFKDHTFKVLPMIYVAGIIVGAYLIIRNQTILRDDPFSQAHNAPLYAQLPFYFLAIIFRKKEWVYWIVNIAVLSANLWLASIFVIE